MIFFVEISRNRGYTADVPLFAASAAVLFAVLPAPSRAQSPAAAPDPGAPFDCSDPKLDDAARARLTGAGDRFTDGCGVAAPEGKRLTRREVRAALEGAVAAPAAAPKPKEIAVPKAAGRATAPLAGAAAAPSAAGLGKTFDGGGGGSAADAVRAAPAAPAPDAPPEIRFSAGFNDRLGAALAASESGRRALDHLRSPDGMVRLPTAAIVDLGGGSIPAQFDRWSADQTLELDRTHVADAALAAAPTEDRARLRARWKDSTKLAAALADDPKLMAAVVGSFDETGVHEYTHAWQARRDRALDLAADGGKEPVEWELEAYREEMRYYHEKLMRDPAAADRDASSAAIYATLLSGYDAFREEITALYQGIANGSFPRLEEALARRKRGGAADVAAVRGEYSKREADFVRNELPRLQKEGYAALVGYYTGSGRPHKSLALIAVAPDAVRAERGPSALAGTLDFLRRDLPAPVSERLDAWQAYVAYLVKTTGNNTMSADLFVLYRRDYHDAFDEKAAEAAAAPTPAARREALEWARAYASYLPEPEKKSLLQKLSAGAKR
jgi:hypothetical protein